MQDFVVQPGENAIAALKEAVTQAAEMQGAVIRLQPGIYEFHHESAAKKKIYITNTQSESENDDFTKTIGILLENARDLTIDGCGAEIRCFGKMTFLTALNCDGLTVRNLTVDYVHPTVTEMTVIEERKGGLVCQVHHDSQYRIEEGKLTWFGENFAFSRGISQIYDPVTDTTWRHYGPMQDKKATWSELKPGVLLLRHGWAKKSYGVRPGQSLQMRDPLRDEVGVFLSGCRNVTLCNVNMRFMHGLGIVAQNCANLMYDSICCAPDPQSGRTVSSFADCAQFSGCRGSITVKNSDFCGAHDDAINVHGTYLKIVKRRDDGLLLRFMHPQTFGIDVFFPGDTVEAFNPKTLLPIAEARVVSVQAQKDPHFMLLQLDNDAGFKVGSVLENSSACPDVHISDCRFSRIPTRGILATTRGKILIENNTFCGIQSASVLIANDALSWYESGYAADVEIQNNEFIDCNGPIVRIHPENVIFKKNLFVHKRVRILNNKASGKPVSWLAAKSTECIFISGNCANFIPLPITAKHCGTIINNDA